MHTRSFTAGQFSHEMSRGYYLHLNWFILMTGNEMKNLKFSNKALVIDRLFTKQSRFSLFHEASCSAYIFSFPYLS